MGKVRLSDEEVEALATAWLESERKVYDYTGPVAEAYSLGKIHLVEAFCDANSVARLRARMKKLSGLEPF